MRRTIPVVLCFVLLELALGETNAQTSVPASRSLPASGPAGSKSVSLMEALRLAARHSPSLAVARARIEQAAALKRKAWASLLPRLTAVGTYTHYDQAIKVAFPDFTSMTYDPTADPPISFGNFDESVIQKQDSFSFIGQLDVPLFNGPAYPTLQAAYDGITVARLQAERARQSVLFAVAQTFYSVVGAQRLLDITRSSLELAEAHLRAAQARLRAGTDPQLLVTRAEIERDQAKEQVIQAEYQLKIARQMLAVLLGLKGEVDAKAEARPHKPYGSADELFAVGLQNRPDYQSVQRSLTLAERTERAAWYRLLPLLNASAMYRLTDTEGFGGSKDSWSVGLTLTVPLYDGGFRYGELREARAKIAEARENLRLVRDVIRSEVLNALAQLESTRTKVTVARHRVKLAQENATAVERSFQAGVASSLDLLDANSALTKARISLASEETQQDMLQIAVEHTLGRFDPLK